MSKPNVERKARQDRDVRERHGFLRIVRRILRATGSPFPHVGRISFRATILACFLLASCGKYDVDSAVLTPFNDECVASDYEGLIKTHLSDLAVTKDGKDRSLIVSELSKMAVKIWRVEPRPKNTCRIIFVIDNPNPLRFSFDVIFYYAIVTFIVDVESVCMNHNDWYSGAEFWIGTGRSQDWKFLRGRYGHPWKRIAEDGTYKYEYLPVCFDQTGKISGYLDG